MKRITMLACALGLFSALTAHAGTQCGGVTCQAIWTGYEFDAQNGACVAMTTSGCRNPFSYRTKQECEATHGRQDGATCMAYWAGYEYDQHEGRCKAVSASGCRNPFRHADQASCEAANQPLQCLEE